MAQRTRVVFESDNQLLGNLRSFDENSRRALTVAATTIAAEAEAWIKSNATWTDRTGNARNGLKGRMAQNGDSIGVIIYHSVPYGIYLEGRWDGRYAILEPAVIMFSPRFIQLAGALVMQNGNP